MADRSPSIDIPPPKRRVLLQVLGPGLITGAADDDPSGIATYSQVGAQFGYGLAWTLVLAYPLMAAIQEISARIGRVTGRGIAGNLRRHYPAWVSGTIVALLLCANLINLGADLGAMGDSLKLLIGGPALPYVVVFGVLSASLQLFVRYARYVSLLKWLCLSLFSYVICAFLIHVSWPDVGWALVRPSASVHGDYLMAMVAVFGTTISPYLFFWQAGMEVEEEKASPAARPLTAAPEQAPRELTRIRIDTYLGMALSNLIALAIVITTAATLHARGTTNVQTSAQAAQALAALAGPLAFVIFAAGIIGTGMLTLPVLAGSAAYAVGEVSAWRVGLRRPVSRAKAFYGTIVVGMALGIAFNFAGLNPIRALYWSAVLNGIVAVPVMVMMMRLASRRSVMADFTLPRWLALIGWGATLVMALAVVALGVSWAW